MKKSHLLLFIFSFVYCFSMAQQSEVSDSQLAFQYYMDKDYAKAADMYQKVYDKSKSKIYFEYYIRCLNTLKDYNTSEKALKKQIKQYPKDLGYLISLGDVYKKQGDIEKGESIYNSTIKKVEKQKQGYIDLANSFTKVGEYQFAEKVYIEGRKDLYREYTFRYELASIYTMQRNYDKMIYEYLELLEEDPEKLNDVQNRMQYYVNTETSEDLCNILRTSLLKKIQTVTDLDVFNKMLMWLYVQEKNFRAALIQAKALDRRYDENGAQIIDIATLALSNRDYDVAENAYKYVINLGEQVPYYKKAHHGLLRLYYDKVIAGQVQSTEEINAIEKKYLEVINHEGKQSTLLLVKDLAHLQAFYLNKKESAITMLREVIEMPRTNRTYRDAIKIELADIMVLTDDIWEAPLIYGQVEQENEHNPTGHLAKFKKAKVAYYLGDFPWAQSQLDVLKASTSKLISNDAFELSQMISDNIGNDSTERAMQTYANAELLVLQNKDSLALLTLDSILTNHSSHSLVDEVYLLKGKILEKAGKYTDAIDFYNKIVKDYGWDILADNALYRIAEIYDYHLDNKEKAMETYKQILVKFQGSIYVIESRKRYRKLRGDSIQ